MKGTGQILYKKAKKLIPGGTMLLSKRPEMFLPELWPSYFSKAKDCFVWDLDGNKFIDCSIMGIGTNSLGYNHDEVDKAVLSTIKKGNMSTLNCPEEVLLAEKLIEINPWADMVRFARSGGEANSIAIRIARASSGKNKVAICGYHGWHDWYLSVNHNTDGDNLNNHLLPGLKAIGVPNDLKNTVFPFEYNNYKQLLSIVEDNDVGVIKMEVTRNINPKNDFLLKVRELATKKNIILIFDECTSGFRETYGGIHKKFNIEPDMAMFGKTLGNGYAITAVVGRREVMESAQKTFISSTFWTERIGPTAALKTLEIMKKEQSWDVITNIGNRVQDKWKKISKNYNVNIKIKGIPSLSTFSFDYTESLEIKTFLTQEFLKRGYLGSTSFYTSLAHNDYILKNYFEVFEEIIFKISKNIDNGLKFKDLLESDVCHSDFKRLN